MARQLAWHQENCVDADVVTRTRVAGRKSLGGNSDAAEAIFVERHCCRLFASSLFNFDEGHSSPAPGD
jgi:hypothetical protein